MFHDFCPLDAFCAGLALGLGIGMALIVAVAAWVILVEEPYHRRRHT